MKKIIQFFIFSGAVLFTYFSCKKESITPTPVPVNTPEFIADDNTFTDYNKWTLLAERTGKDPLLGIFHNADVPGIIRKVYIKDNAQRVNGQYPVGTIIVKEYRNANGTLADFDQLAMVKRGGVSFNTAFNNWEWFRLDRTNTKIAVIAGEIIRGGTLGDNACNNCHSGAKNKDLVFTGN
ncbi:MAG: cytochrome P460 family protein [Saprospiraceae bacterium]